MLLLSGCPKQPLGSTPGNGQQNLCIGRNCDDTNPCTIDSCDESTGSCINSNVADGTNCGTNMECISGLCTRINRCVNVTCTLAGEQCNPGTGTCECPTDYKACIPQDKCIQINKCCTNADCSGSMICEYSNCAMPRQIKTESANFQGIYDWSVTFDKEFYYDGETMNITIYFSRPGRPDDVREMALEAKSTLFGAKRYVVGYVGAMTASSKTWNLSTQIGSNTSGPYTVIFALTGKTGNYLLGVWRDFRDEFYTTTITVNPIPA